MWFYSNLFARTKVTNTHSSKRSKLMTSTIFDYGKVIRTSVKVQKCTNTPPSVLGDWFLCNFHANQSKANTILQKTIFKLVTVSYITDGSIFKDSVCVHQLQVVHNLWAQLELEPLSPSEMVVKSVTSDFTTFLQWWLNDSL